MPSPSPDAPKLLVIDDEPAILLMLNRALAQADLSITTAENGVEGLALYEANPANFDLILTDIQMPQMDGIEFARHLQEHHPSARICLMTGQQWEIKEELPPNVLHLFAKPFTSLASLADVLRGLVADKTCC